MILSSLLYVVRNITGHHDTACVCVFIHSVTTVAQWLRCCATNRKVTGSIPAGVSGFFMTQNPSNCTMALGLTQLLTEMSTRSISWGLGQPVCKVDNLPPSCAVITKSGKLNFLEPSGPVQACNGTALCLPCLYIFNEILSVIFLVLRR